MTIEHERASELLPWYVNATLDSQEAKLVEEHLGSCLVCRQELARCRELSDATVSADGGGWTPSPAHFARVMARVEAAERTRGPALLRRLVSWIRDTPRPMRFAFALQGAVALALLAVVVLRPPVVYQTLSQPPASSPSHRARLHVVFAPDLTEAGMRQLLSGVEAVIVGGPTPTGLYTLELPFPAADRERASQVAARLQAESKVRFATPVAR